MQLTRDGNPAPGASGMYSTFTGPVVYTEADKFQKVDFDDVESGKAKHATQGRQRLGRRSSSTTSRRPGCREQGKPREFYTRRIENNLYSVGALEPLGRSRPGQTVSNRATAVRRGRRTSRSCEKVAPGLDLVWTTAG